MPPAIVAIGAAIAGSAIATAVGLTVGTFAFSAVAFAASAVVSALGNKLIGGQGSAPSAGPQERRETIRSPIAARRVVYGQIRCGGVLVYAGSSGSGNEYANLVVAVCQGEIDGIGSDTWLNDKLLTDPSFDGLVDQYFHLGEADQLADAALVAEKPTEWTADHRLRGIAYVYLRLKYDANAFPTGLPSPAWLVRGRKIEDPRSSDPAAWSNNPALCVLDYLRADFGMRCPDNLIDLDSFIAAANICDEEVEVLGDEESSESGPVYVPRYRMNGLISLDATPSQIIAEMEASCGGKLIYSQGKYRFYAGAFEMPTFTLTADMLRANVTFRTQPARNELFNVVRGTYVEPLNDWQQSDFAPQRSAEFLADDNGVEIEQTIGLPFVTHGATAQRLARQSLARSRGLTLQVQCNWMALPARLWDVIYVDLPDVGIDDETFRIVSYTIPDSGGVDMTLRAETPDMYDWSTADETRVIPAPTSQFNNDGVPGITGLMGTLTEQPIDTGGGGA